MNKDTLARLELLNQIKLDDAQKDATLSFFAKREEERTALDAIDTSNTEPMVHVMPTALPLREDEVVQSFTREQLQSHAPLTDVGYWCVPRVIE